MIFHDYSRTATILPPPIALKNSSSVLVTNFDINNIKKFTCYQDTLFLKVLNEEVGIVMIFHDYSRTATILPPPIALKNSSYVPVTNFDINNIKKFTCYQDTLFLKVLNEEVGIVMIFHDYSRTATILPPPIALKNSSSVLVTNFDINNIKKFTCYQDTLFLKVLNEEVGIVMIFHDYSRTATILPPPIALKNSSYVPVTNFDINNIKKFTCYQDTLFLKVLNEDVGIVMIFHDYSRTATILPPPIALKNSILVYVLVTNFDINNIKKIYLLPGYVIS